MALYKKVAAGAAGTLGASYLSYKLFFPWLKEDIRDMKILGGIQKAALAQIEQNITLITAFEMVAARLPDKYCIIQDNRVYTYQQVNEQANRVAHLAKTWNIQPDETVSLVMYNEPAYIWIFLGLAKIGVTVSLINYNLRQKPLIHCVKAAKSKIVILGKQLIEAIDDIKPEIPDVGLYISNIFGHGVPPGYLPFTDILATFDKTMVGPEARKHVTLQHNIGYLYTSGTTGLPKPAHITQVRSIMAMTLLKVAGFKEKDVIYTCMPLYHGAGLVIGVLSAINSGGTVVLRDKFSATHFWEDCRRHKVTYIQYIGEMLRYLLAKPKHPRDGEHNIQVAIGNGLRMDIWQEVQERFKIPRIVEIFGASEGPGLLLNLSNKVGACGRYSPLFKALDKAPKVLVKYDLDTGDPVRNKQGRCIQVKTGEPGLMLGAFPDYMNPQKIYLGTKEQNAKKLIRNAFKEGDVYFNYGDLLYLDKNYYLYFVDRLGDTFRWKGENVSTTEVGNVISELEFVIDANVYGVEIPGTEGRIGMVTLQLVDDKTSLSSGELKDIYTRCVTSLPQYARPLFLRVPKELDITGTYKQKKTALQKEGFDINVITDPVYFRDDDVKSYIPFTENLYKNILTGKAKL